MGFWLSALILTKLKKVMNKNSFLIGDKFMLFEFKYKLNDFTAFEMRAKVIFHNNRIYPLTFSCIVFWQDGTPLEKGNAGGFKT
jgi:hypothetical protein